MRVLVAVLLAAAALPAAAQSNAERIANDHYTRSHDYDLVHQRIAVSKFDWDSTAFAGEVTTTIAARREGLDSVILDAGALLKIDAATDARGRALRTARAGDTLVVYLPAPLRFGASATFTIRYQGKVRNGRGLTFITPDGLPGRPQQIWSQGEDMDNHFWFPTYDFPNDKATWEVVATVPKGFTAVSNGRLVTSRTNRDGTRTFDWREDRPASTYLVSLIVAPLRRLHDTWQGIPVDYYVYAGDTAADSARAWRLFHETPDMIGTYSKLTGVKYPWAKYAQTTVADFFGGMENVSATTLVDWLPDARAYHDRPWYAYILIPHELAHQWFGDFVTTENWANMWLNEGFAEFMPGQYWDQKLGAHAEQDYYLDEYRQYLQIEARRSMPLASSGSNNIYPKGALVLEMLKQYLGPERFWASLHTYLTRHAFDNATSDDLRQAVLDATGENLDWFWSEWVYQAGLPEFAVTAAWDSSAHAVTLTVRQTQADTLKADTTGLRFTVPRPFRMPVTVRVASPAGEVTHTTWLGDTLQTITVPGVAQAPTMVIFDDGNRILKRLTFDEPTPWLAAQLAHDANLWDRAWAIAELGHRTTDSAAALALAGAARHADYYLTRQAAVEALGGFPAETALPAVTDAARDTSAAVRQAAVAALGQLGGDRALALVRAAADSDPSYEVRAAAVLSLVRLDSAGALATIHRAIATPSYQDAIQNAALRAIALTRDTALAGTVDGLTRTNRLAMHVLAFLGSHGSTRAADLLTAHLDGPTRHERSWALEAFRFSFQPADSALARLKAAVGHITHPGARQAVQDAIAQMEKGSGGDE